MSEVTLTTSIPTGRFKSSPAGTLLGVLAAIVAVLGIGAGFVAPDRETVGIYGIVVLLSLLLLGLHAGIAMGFVGVWALFLVQGQPGVWSALGNVPYDTASGWALSVLPMFTLMGFLLWKSGATQNLFSGARAWTGWLPGGLSVTTNLAGSALGAASGSTISIAYALSRVAIPEMLRAGYPKRLAVTSVMMGGSGGALIPPSIAGVVYAGIASTSVGKQMIAGLIPGIILVSAYFVYLVVVAHRQRKQFSEEANKRFSWNDRWKSLKSLWQVPAVIVIVIGGMFAGFFTATEAGAVGAGAALILLVSYKRTDSLSALGAATGGAVASVGSIYLLLIGASIFARSLAATGTTAQITSSISALDVSRISLLLILVVFYVILGIFLDPIPLIVLTVPLLLPILPVFDINPIWFGVFVVLMGELALVTPPVGMLLFIVYRIVQDPEINLGQKITLKDMYASALSFLPIIVALAVLLILVPEIATWLPDLSFTE